MILKKPISSMLKLKAIIHMAGAVACVGLVGCSDSGKAAEQVQADKQWKDTQAQVAEQKRLRYEKSKAACVDSLGKDACEKGGYVFE